MPEALADIVGRAMARDRAARYQTAGEFRDGLVTFLRGYAPNYRRTRLANYMRGLWAREIDLEIRTLLEYALSEEPAAASVDLLAGASLEDSAREVSRALDVGSIPAMPNAPAVPVLPAGAPLAVRADDLFASELNAPSFPPPPFERNS